MMEDKDTKYQSAKLLSQDSAVENIVRLAHAGMTPINVTNRASRLHDTFLVPLTGEVVTIEPDVVGINAEVSQPESLVDFIKSDDRNPNMVRIFVSDLRIHGIFEDGNYTTREVVCPLNVTAAWRLLEGYCNSKAYLCQEDLWVLLVRDFAGMIERSVVEQIRAAIVRMNAQKHSETGAARQVRETSYDEAVRDKDGNDFPEDIILRVPVFDLAGARDTRYEVPIKLLARSIKGEVAFCLLPQSLAMSATRDAAVNDLVERINTRCDDKDLDATVLYGEPITKLRDESHPSAVVCNCKDED